jgi:hypothetical protein
MTSKEFLKAMSNGEVEEQTPKRSGGYLKIKIYLELNTLLPKSLLNEVE